MVLLLEPETIAKKSHENVRLLLPEASWSAEPPRWDQTSGLQVPQILLGFWGQGSLVSAKTMEPA